MEKPKIQNSVEPFNQENMKYLLFLFFSCILSVGVMGQPLIPETCKKKDVEILSLPEEWPEHTIGVKLNDILLDRKASDLSDLSAENISEIQRWSRKFKSCTVYVDFEGKTVNRDLNPTLTDNHLAYFIVLKQEE